MFNNGNFSQVNSKTFYYSLYLVDISHTSM